MNDSEKTQWGYVEKLLSISSDSILPAPRAGFSFSAAQPVGGLYRMLKARNGFYAFESALHVFPMGSREGVMDLETWNSETLWRCFFGALTKGCLFFAQDAVGMQFCFRGGEICTFDPECGVITPLCPTIQEWANALLRDYPRLTAYPLAQHWQAINGPLPIGNRLYPKIPFHLGREYEVENLYAGDPVERMNFYGSLVEQIKDLPPGSKVRLRVV